MKNVKLKIYAYEQDKQTPIQYIVEFNNKIAQNKFSPLFAFQPRIVARAIFLLMLAHELNMTE